MSKLFNMLYKNKGASSDPVLPVVEERAAVNAEFKSERTAAGETAAVPQAEMPGAPQFRPLSLRVAAPSPLLPFVVART